MSPLSSQSFVAVVALAVMAVVSSACSNGAGETVAGAGDLRHIHDFALDNDGTLLVASHTGLYRIEDLDRAVLVGNEQHDLMAMTQADNGHLTASGHPDLRLLQEYRVEGKEPHLGIIESDDMGRTWEQRGLLGDADFHAFVATPDGMYAAESTGGKVWYRSGDGPWERRGQAPINDLAADPTNPERVIGTDLDGALWISNDAATTWEQVDVDIAPIEIEWPAVDAIYGIDRSGIVWTTTEPAGTWEQIATGPEPEPETFWVHDNDLWWLSTHGGDIWRSDDRGNGWTRIYRSPN